MPDVNDTRRLEEALREIRMLAAEDRRRGIDYWYDRDLADALRELARDISADDHRSSSAQPTPEGGRRPHPPAAAGAVSSAGSAAGAVSPAAAGGPDQDSRIPDWGPPPAAEGRPKGWEAALQSLAAEAAECRDCELCASRKQVVFGTGKAETPLVFVGEAPGADEDAQGVPFVGRAGQLLTRIIAAIGLTRDQVYIANILKCRPPGNRNPAPDEIASCRKHLDRQLELLRPRVICTLGLVASQILLESPEPIGKLRGRVFERDGYRIVPTYHPAALLRNPSLKALVWEDVQKVRRILDGGVE